MEKNATRYHRLVCISFCDKTTPVTKLLALVDVKDGITERAKKQSNI